MDYTMYLDLQYTTLQLIGKFKSIPPIVTSLILKESWLNTMAGTELAKAFAVLGVNIKILSLNEKTLIKRSPEELAELAKALPNVVTIELYDYKGKSERYKKDELFKKLLDMKKDPQLLFQPVSIGVNTNSFFTVQPEPMTSSPSPLSHLLSGNGSLSSAMNDYVGSLKSNLSTEMIAVDESIFQPNVPQTKVKG